MIEHPCCDSRAQFHIVDVTGATIITFLKLCENAGYFGGANIDDAYLRKFTAGPHYWTSRDGILGMLANIVGEKMPIPWTIRGLVGTYYESLQLVREMDAEKLASILGCETTPVIEYFERTISIR